MLFKSGRAAAQKRDQVGVRSNIVNFAPDSAKVSALALASGSSSLTTALPAGGLANGQSFNVQFLTNVVAIGRFRFYISIEALP